MTASYGKAFEPNYRLSTAYADVVIGHNRLDGSISRRRIVASALPSKEGGLVADYLLKIDFDSIIMYL